MPRVIRDSDEEVDTKSSTRRTRATSAASSVSVTDSPARRTTRSNKQLAIIESSPESLDDSNSQPAVRKTRSRAATLDKSTAVGIGKNLRSRKNSASSNVSEAIDMELETTQKRVTRKVAAAAAVVGTPTKINPRTRNLRAGSEAKSTPPATRSTRVTRASSVDPVNIPNESVGTPVKKRTRASIVPVQQPLAEEQEDQNKTPESLNNTVLEIDEDSENESLSTKDKASKKLINSRKELEKSSSTEHSSLDTSKKNEGNMTDKSCASKESNGDSILQELTSHSITSNLDSFTFREKENSEKIDSKPISDFLVLSTDENWSKSFKLHSNGNDNNCDSVKHKVDTNDDECEHIDVENITLTDDSIDVVNSPKKVAILVRDIKDSYVKLNRTNLVENLVSDKLEESKNNDNNLSVKLKDTDSVSQSNMITSAKTAIVLVNDFVKSNEYFSNMKDQQIFDSGISFNNKDNVNSNISVHHSDDQMSIISVEDSDEVLSSPNRKETRNDEVIVEVLPDKNNYSSMVTDDAIFVNANNNSGHKFNSDKSDDCLEENNVPESKSKSKNLIVIDEKNNETESSGEVNIKHKNVVKIATKIGDDWISENSNKVNSLDALKIINALDNTVINLNLLYENDPHDVSVNLAVSEFKDEKQINDVTETLEIENLCPSGRKSKVDSDESIIEKSDSVNVNNSVDAEKNNIVTDTNEQLELMDMSNFESNSKDNRDIKSPYGFNETSSNQIVPKLSLEDKTGVPSAVTDADGDNASSQFKEEEIHKTGTNTASTKFPEKNKRKSKARVMDSDLDESAENLFQDIPAEEWSQDQSKRKSIESKMENSFDKGKFVVEEPRNGTDDENKVKKSRMSSDKNELDHSVVEITNVVNGTGNQGVNVPLSKKIRKSVEKKRESGQSSDSGIQDGNKTVVDIDPDENDNGIKESRCKLRPSLDNSLKLNQSFPVQDKYDSITDKLSKSLIDHKSSSKSRKSLNNSSQFNVSVLDTLQKRNDSLTEITSASFNTSTTSRKQSLNDARKSIPGEKIEGNSEAEAMEVGEEGNSENEMNNVNEFPNKSRQSFNKSQIDQSPTKSDSISEKPSDLLNPSKNTKRLSLEKSMNKSSRKSLIKIQEEGTELSQGENPSKNLSTSLNESKKLEKRLLEKFNDSDREFLVGKQNELEESEGKEMDVDMISDQSSKQSRKSLNESSSNKSLNQKSLIVSNGKTDKSLKLTSDRKSVKSLNSSDVLVDSESEIEPIKNNEKKNKFIINSPKFASKSPVKVSIVNDVETSDEPMTEDSPKKKKGQEVETASLALDHSLQKSIERMKFSNPPNHDISTVAQVNSSSEDASDDNQISYFTFKLSDEEETKDFSDEEKKEETDVDSDIEREYNLGGKSISKYSDDDVPGDDCRVSEEESSDNEDDGADLQNFVVPDEEVDDEDENDDDEEEKDEENNEVSENEDENDEDEAPEVEDSKEKKVNKKKNVSFHSSQSNVKNTSGLRRSDFSESSGSESDDEATEAERKNSKERFDLVNDSEKLAKNSKALEEQSTISLSMVNDQNVSLQKDKSMNKSSKSAKSKVSSSSESDNESTVDESKMKANEKSTNVSGKNKSLNLSKSIKDRSINISKGNTSVSKSEKITSIHIVDDDETESSSTESDADGDEKSESMQIVSPSEAESESEEGEDYYHIVNAGSRDASLIKHKSNKLIDCSTPKPGAAKKTNFSKDNLSITASRRKSGSLNDLTNKKLMSSRLSIGEAASKSMKDGDTSMKLKDDVEIVATPDTVTKTRQVWKLIPLNHTAHPSVEDTPGTKFLKKSKLNDSVPVLDSMKSSDLGSAVKKGKKSTHKESQLETMLKEDKKSKKRKLLDMSSVQSVDEDSILKVSKKNKKRTRFDNSASLLIDEQEEVDRNKTKKNKKGKQATETEEVKEVHTSKKKKYKADEVEVVEAPEELDKPKRKRKEKLLNGQEIDQNMELEKPKKKKSKVLETEPVQNQKLKNKNKKYVASNSDDEAPESIAFEEATKESLRKNQKYQVDRILKDKPMKSLKRLPEDVLDNLTDEPLRRPDKRQKLSRNKERSVIMPSKSMFSPGKKTPENLHVDDGYIPLSSTGGTTQFAIVNLQKAKKVVKKSAPVLSFRDKMLARNMRMPTSMYLSFLKKQKAKNNL